MKKMLLLAITSLALSPAFAQSFMHGAGVAIFVDKVKDADANGIGGLTYSPRYNFLETESLSLSIGVPLTVGISGGYSYSSSVGQSSSIGFMFNAPLILNLNLGCGSSKETESRFGFFIGGGAGYHYGTYADKQQDVYGNDYESSSSISAIGPAANLGLRFAVGQHQKNIETRLSYMKGMNDKKVSVFGLAALFNF
jgi:hypothetical protein